MQEKETIPRERKVPIDDKSLKKSSHKTINTPADNPS